MAILIVNGATIPVATSSGASMSVQEIGGDTSRMFDGSLRSTVRGRKRVWSVTTRLLTATERTTIETALDASPPPVSCSGDLLGGTVTCIAERTTATPQWTQGQLRWVVTFTLSEV